MIINFHSVAQCFKLERLEKNPLLLYLRQLSFALFDRKKCWKRFKDVSHDKERIAFSR